MTKQEIIDLIKDNLQYECYNGFGVSEYSINTAEIYNKADTLLAKIEQEKKETAREILQKVNRAIDRIDDYDSRHTAKLFIAEIADEYEV